MARNPLQTNRDWLTQPLAPAWWPGQTSLQDQLARWQAMGQAQPAPYGQSLTSATPLQNEIAPGTMPTTGQMAAEPVSRYVDPWSGQLTAEGQQHAENAIDMAMAMGGVGPSGGGFRAFHGSPHLFDQFDASKIGTGEGAQAYGHGMYFADNEAVAREYRDALQGQGSPAYQAAEKEFNDAHYNFDGSQAAHDRIAAAESALADARRANPGHMYEVQVNADPAHFLDWDKPLSEQSQHVRDALAKLSPEVRANIQGASRVALDNPDGVAARKVATGQQFYKDLADAHSRMNGDPTFYEIPAGKAVKQSITGAAQALHEAGIPGIRYLDAGSRGAGEGSRNTVVFSPEIMNIIRKYGIAGLMAGGAGAASVQNQTPSGGDQP